MDNLTLDEIDWFNKLPDFVKEVVRKYPYNQLYKIKDTRQICHIISYGEKMEPKGEVSLTVYIHTGHNKGMGVFGIEPEHLEPYQGEIN